MDRAQASDSSSSAVFILPSPEILSGLVHPCVHLSKHPPSLKARNGVQWGRVQGVHSPLNEAKP